MSNTYLAVEVAVEEGDEEALEGDQEVGGVGPQAELHHAVRRGVDQVHDVRDAQQGEQHDGRLYCFPLMLTYCTLMYGLASLSVRQFSF